MEKKPEFSMEEVAESKEELTNENKTNSDTDKEKTVKSETLRFKNADELYK